MKNKSKSTLIIIANPSKESFSYAMANAYIKTKQNYKIIDLYEINQGYLNYKTMKDLYKGDIKESKKRDEIQKQISEASEIVFFFPIWWGGIPAILKNFFDVNFSSGFAFNYKNGKQEGLLKGKTAKVFCTCDAPGIIYKYSFFTGINIKRFLNKSIFNFCGIKLEEFKLFSAFHKISKKNKEKILNNI